MMKFNSKVCHICGNKALLKYSGHPGYKMPEVFDIFHCSTCDTSFADPLTVDDKIYEDIYINMESIPGYQRYLQYASSVLHFKEPLNYLAQTEDVYWAVKSYLDNITKKIKILEVGSGLGYLTYSIAQSGFDITGLDISTIAVSKAKKRYGDYFICADLYEYSKVTGKVYDVVIMTEVIEHIPNIYQMFEAINALLTEGGEIVMTSPNKSAFSSKSLWETDAPPVHLWWFSETSVRFIANHFGYSVKFINFTEFNKNNYQKSVAGKASSHPTNYPFLDTEGKPCSKERSIWKAIKNVLHYLKVVKLVRSLELALVKLTVGVQEKRPTMCVVFSKNNFSV